MRRPTGPFGPRERPRAAALRAIALACLSSALLVLAVQACGDGASNGSGGGGGGGGGGLGGGAPPSNVFSLFDCSPCDPWPGDYGVAGCTTQTPAGTCNSNCSTYTTSIENGIQMTAGNDCHTVNSHEACTFSIGDAGVTQIDFDFTVTDACHQTVATTEWLSFWIYSRPWNSTVEADFIESLHGPGGENGGLNSNFAGNGHQVEFFTNATPDWSGHITAKFSGSGTAVATTISNSHDSQVASFTMTNDTGYFFVMDTALGSGGNTQCSFTISNLTMQGTVPAGQCTGLVSP